MGQERTQGRTSPTDVTSAQDRYRLLFERSPDAVVVTGTDGRILDFNAAAMKFFALPGSELGKTNVTTFYANRDDRQTLIKQANTTGLIHDTPVIFVDSRSRVKHSLVTTMRLDNPDGSARACEDVVIAYLRRDRRCEQWAADR